MMANQWLKQYCQFCISPKSVKATLTKAFSVLMLSACIVSGLNNSAHAGTTTADFLKWEQKSQKAFLHTSITMIGVVASQVNPAVTACIDNWYLKTNTIREERNKEIVSGMKDYGEYHPSTVILAFVEQECGKIK